MQNPFQPNLRKPWLLLCTTLLLVYSIMPVERETLFFSGAPSPFLEALMFLLSFPLGTAAMLLFHADDFGVFQRFAFWAAAMGLGYAQWFHLFPALLGRARPAANPLNLSDGAAAPRARRRGAPARPAVQRTRPDAAGEDSPGRGRLRPRAAGAVAGCASKVNNARRRRARRGGRDSRGPVTE